MEKFFKIIGIIIVAWIVFSLIGWIVGFLFHALLWIAIIVGIAYIVSTFVMRKKTPGRR